MTAEAAIAVAHHWGVSMSTVFTWRRALGVPRENEGTARLVRHYLAIGRPISWSAESRAKTSTAHARRPPCPQFRAAAREAARRPKSEVWKQMMSEMMKEQWAKGIRRNPFGKAAD